MCARLRESLKVERKILAQRGVYDRYTIVRGGDLVHPIGWRGYRDTAHLAVNDTHEEVNRLITSVAQEDPLYGYTLELAYTRLERMLVRVGVTVVGNGFSLASRNIEASPEHSSRAVEYGVNVRM